MADSLSWLNPYLGGGGGRLQDDDSALQYLQDVLSGQQRYSFDRPYFTQPTFGQAQAAPAAAPAEPRTRLEIDTPTTSDPMLAYRYERPPPQPQREPPQTYQTAPDTIPFNLDRTPVPDTGEGTQWNNAMRWAREAPADIGNLVAGLAERANLGAANMLGLRSPGAPFHTGKIDVGPGLSKVSDLGTFATGGLSSTLYPVAGTLRAGAQYALPAAREAGRDVLPMLQGVLADEAGALRMYPGAPPHIQTMEDLLAWQDRQLQTALEGRKGRRWYTNSGQAIGDVTGYVPGEDPTRATKLAEGVGITSPQTPVPANANYSVQGHHMAMAGEPIVEVGKTHNTMSPKLNDVYWHDEPWGGRKTNNYTGSFLHELGIIDEEPGLVNDIREMRAGEYAGGEKSRTKGGYYGGTPTSAQYDFMEGQARHLVDRLNQIDPTDGRWDIKQTQAAKWVVQRARQLGISVDEAAFDIADAFRQMTAQHSLETIPGGKTRHLPEMFDADPALKWDMHREIMEALTDPRTGRDRINSHFGLLTGRTFEAPGAFEGRVNPGSQAPTILGTAKGTASMLADPYSRELANTADWTKALVLAQDANAWTRPFYRKGDPLHARNLADINIGRTMTDEETLALYKVLEREAKTDAFPPIGRQTGARILNVPDYTKIDNRAFQAHVRKALNEVYGPSSTDAELVFHAGDSGYTPIDWEAILRGQDYRAGSPTRRSDLLRRADELVSTLGPQVAKIHDKYASRYGWTVNPAVRFWERPGFAAAPQELIPPTPWTSGGVTPSGVAVPKRAPPKGKTKGLLGEIAGDEP